MKNCKDCVLENYEIVQKFDNYTKIAENLRDVEIRPSDDFLCQYSVS